MRDRERLGQFTISFEEPDNFEAWREKARPLAAAGVPPADIVWVGSRDSIGSLFSAENELPGLVAGKSVRATKAFIEIAAAAMMHRDDCKYALLYSLLWRLQSEPGLMNNLADPEVHKLASMARQVRRDIHKMRAFVRFRRIGGTDGDEAYIAWFDPDHYITRRNADFFVNRFSNQNWSILTPDISLHWDKSELREGPGARREDAPGEDDAEGLWQSYYKSIFNPARLKIRQMKKEMPRRYWKNLPEAKLIPGLIAGAQAREATMIAEGQQTLSTIERPATLEAVADAIAVCRNCAIGCNGTRAVAGEGPSSSKHMIVGEQPGDREEETGRPFRGPAGRMLNIHLQHAEIDRKALWVTNAVKHFKYEPRGKARLHKNPSAREIDHCRWWLDAERQILKPRSILALGASAGRALLGRTPSIGRERGKPIALPDGTQLLLTVHPSSLLRLNDELRAEEEIKFQEDIRLFRQLMILDE